MLHQTRHLFPVALAINVLVIQHVITFTQHFTLYRRSPVCI